jgi:hypothetical protein
MAHGSAELVWRVSATSLFLIFAGISVAAGALKHRGL